MELGKIKARIREKGCNPTIPMVLPGSNKIIWVTVQKSSLMAELDKVFPTKVSETGLMFDGEKLLPAKGALATAAAIEDSRTGRVERAESLDDIMPDDDLLGGDLLDDDAPDPHGLTDDEDLLA